MKGTVKFFNEQKGFGFIESDESDKDVFVGSRGLSIKLKEGDKVTFDVEETPRGKAATNVTLDEESSDEE